MKFHCDCFQCIAKHALESARLVTKDERVHMRVMREVMRNSADIDPRMSPPAMVQLAHRAIRRSVGDPDPYREAKRRHTRMALSLLPTLERRVRRAKDPFEMAVRFAIAGNCIDMGTRLEIGPKHVLDTLERAAKAPLEGDARKLAAAARGAGSILYLADNAGEIVFDRLVLARLPKGKTTVAVRGGPVINDATMEDARASGLMDVVPVIDNGSDAPGTILRDCSSGFKKRFREAGLVIAKGQGNYETLSDAGRRIVFLLIAKCGIICDSLGMRQGDMVIRDHRPRRRTRR